MFRDAVGVKDWSPAAYLTGDARRHAEVKQEKKKEREEKKKERKEKKKKERKQKKKKTRK